MKKICSKCKKEKELSEFHKAKKEKSGLASACKICSKKYYENNKEKIIQRSNENYEKNKEIILQKEKLKRLQQLQKNPEEYLTKRREQSKKWRKLNSEKMKDARNNWKEKNPDYHKEYANSHKREKSINDRKYEKERIKTDPLFALSKRIRNSIRQSLRNCRFSKNSNTQEILGCTFNEFKLHIEKQFAEGMSWDNRELWHIDHIYPVSKAVNEEHLIQLNHYTNLQPLWAEDNLKKGNKILS